MFNSAGPKYWPLRNINCHWHPLGHGAPDHNSLSATIQPVPYPARDPSVKHTTAQFRDKDVLWDRVKCFAEVQADDICCSSLINQACNTPQKVTTFVGHNLPSVKSCWLSPFTPPFSLSSIHSLDLTFLLFLTLYYLSDRCCFGPCLQSTWHWRTDHPEHSC